MSADLTEDILEKLLERRLFLLFSDNLAVVLDFLTLQDKHNITTLSVDIRFICTRCEKGQKIPPKAHFHPVCKARKINFDIFR